MVQKNVTFSPEDTIPGTVSVQNTNIRQWEIVVNDETGYEVISITGCDLWGVNHQLISLHGYFISVYTKKANITYVNLSGKSITINTLVLQCLYRKA